MDVISHSPRELYKSAHASGKDQLRIRLHIKPIQTHLLNIWMWPQHPDVHDIFEMAVFTKSLSHLSRLKDLHLKKFNKFFTFIQVLVEC
jgi:hypothetical protein